jgi:putative hemolysin
MSIIFALLALTLFMIVLIYLSGWFSGTETALTKLSSPMVSEMRRKKEKNIEYIIDVKKNMNRTLVAILIGNNLVNIILSSIAALVANALFNEIGVTVMVALITFLIIIFGEITPKSNAIINPKKISQRNVKGIFYLSKILAPLITLFMTLSHKLILISGGSVEKKSLLITDDSIKGMATLGEEEGVIKKIESDIIHKVFLFGDRKIDEIMVPMTDVFHIDKNLPVAEAKKIIRERGFTRVPVMNNEGKVSGLVYSKDLLGKMDGTIFDLIRKPFIVSSKRDVTDIFNAMKEKRIHMAVIENKEHEHVGIVTLEDIIEELVGEIYDEYFEQKFASPSNGDREKKVRISTP